LNILRDSKPAVVGFGIPSKKFSPERQTAGMHGLVSMDGQ